MANTSRPFGLKPVRYLNGSPWNGRLNIYYIPSTDANAYAIGDPVATLTGAASAGGISAVTQATGGASNALRGVIMTAGEDASQVLFPGGPFVDPANLATIVIPASKTKNYFVGVVDDPWVIFEVQEYGGSGYTALTAADVGKGINLKSVANNSYISQWQLDTTAASSTSSTRQVRLLQLTQRTDNAFGQYAHWDVLINQHEFKASTAGV